MDETMRCGHILKTTECFIEDGEVFVQFTCVKGCVSHWQYVGDRPCHRDVDILETKIIDKK